MGILDVTTSGRAKAVTKGGLKAILERDGRFPPIDAVIAPLEKEKPQFKLKKFLSYEINSSVLTPVDTFNFTVAAPEQVESPMLTIRSGDIFRVNANNQTLGTGLIDVAEIETSATEGESISFMGRDMISQLEDNDAVKLDLKPVFGGSYTPSQVLDILVESTRIPKNNYVFQDAPKQDYLFATEPQETKLSALQRYSEPLNCIFWANEFGQIVFGRPNQSQPAKGTLYMLKEQRRSNVLSIKVSYQTTKVTNVVVPIWSGQEQVANIVGQQNALFNSKIEPTRLRENGHIVQKTVVVSNPTSTDPQGQAEVNRFQAGQQNLLQSYAKRELARTNVNERNVQIKVGGHYDENGDPFRKDTVYKIRYDRGNIDENMYLYEANYVLTEEEGQVTYLSFCPLGSIVADIIAP